ncbi:MAG: hypothetical protein KJ607_06060, partial [Bacteroidetes bacterium]|nr:hypothetical protein [Bacteroidota bacterium]
KTNGVIGSDVVSYYSYLPAILIHKDPRLSFLDNPPADFNGVYWPGKAPNGNYVIKYSMGLAICYSPFFLLAHGAAHILGYDTQGFSAPYRFAVQISAVFYLILGLLLLRRLLSRHFAEKVVFFTLLCILFGTNLFYYSSIEAAMTHAYTFSFIAAFLCLLDSWLEQITLPKTLLIGFLLGLITLIRPSDCIIIVFFFLWKITSLNDLKARVLMFIRHYPFILLMACMALLVWLPQMLYWKYVTGQYLYYSYGTGERFFFNNPQIIRGLIGFRKGWFIYTPVMAFAFIGIPFLLWRYKRYFIAILVFTLLNIYIVLSWWCWWYGGSFGLRAFIDSYCILAFPLAAFFSWIFDRPKIIRGITYLAFSFLIVLNLFQTHQYYGGKRLHWDSMTWEAYRASFGRWEKPEGFDRLLAHPDYDKAGQGIQETISHEEYMKTNPY